MQTYKNTMRHKNKIHTRKPRTTCYGIKNIMYEGVQLFNNLPNSIKTCTTVKELKKISMYIYAPWLINIYLFIKTIPDNLLHATIGNLFI